MTKCTYAFYILGIFIIDAELWYICKMKRSRLILLSFAVSISLPAQDADALLVSISGGSSRTFEGWMQAGCDKVHSVAGMGTFAVQVEAQLMTRK